MSQPFVAVLMGSDSDLPVMEATIAVLRQLDIPFEAKITSAHRTPAVTHDYVNSADQRGCAVFIAAAGMAAHLAGALAAHSNLPVLGIPVDAGPLKGQDALLSTAMMPPGIPVGTLGIGSSGAKNAALLAARILALSDPDLRQRLRAHRDADRDKTLAKDRAARERFGGG